jgi:DNA-binding GntR family transcriptional regulator
MKHDHRAFHMVLIASSGMPLLLQFCGTLHDLNDRCRQLFLKKYPAERFQAPGFLSLKSSGTNSLRHKRHTGQVCAPPSITRKVCRI